MAELAFPWERAAMRGEPLPEGLPPEEQHAYLSLRQVYRDYCGKVLSREAAAGEKRRIARQAQAAGKRRVFADRLTEHHWRVTRDTEAAKAACRKDPSPENALRLCDVLDGLEKWEGVRRHDKSGSGQDSGPKDHPGRALDV